MGDPVLEMLDRLRDRPAVYIGRYSAEALFMYLVGYTAALGDHTSLDLSRYQEFIDGLYSKYGRGGGGHSWGWILNQAAGGDAEALNIFFADLASFQEKHADGGHAPDRPREAK